MGFPSRPDGDQKVLRDNRSSASPRARFVSMIGPFRLRQVHAPQTSLGGLLKSTTGGGVP